MIVKELKKILEDYGEEEEVIIAVGYDTYNILWVFEGVNGGVIYSDNKNKIENEKI